MVYDTTLAERMRPLMPNGVTEKQMFGGIAFLYKGKMFCGIVKHDMMVRIPKEQHDDLVASPNTRTMDFTGKPMKGYLFISPDGTKKLAQLKHWIDISFAYVKTLV